MTLLNITLDRGFATLLAAIIAAGLSLLTYLSTKPTEIRAANRKSLEPFIHGLSDSVHQLIAISNILLKTKTEESRGNWRGKAEKAKAKLKKLRPKIRYSLWGLEKYLLDLTRLPDYTLYTLENIDVAKKVVKRGTRLGDKIDKCIRDCYLNGSSPKLLDIWVIRFYSWHFTKTRNDYKAKRMTGNK